MKAFEKLIAIVACCLSVFGQVAFAEHAADSAELTTNHGLVLLRTAGKSREKDEPAGLFVVFRNTETGRKIKNSSGWFGRPGAKQALWFPPGSYELVEVFDPAGRLSAMREPLRFEVKAGEAVFIGTIASGGSFPSDVLREEDIVNGQMYQRHECLSQVCFRYDAVVVLDDVEDFSDFGDESIRRTLGDVRKRLLGLPSDLSLRAPSAGFGATGLYAGSGDRGVELELALRSATRQRIEGDIVAIGEDQGRLCRSSTLRAEKAGKHYTYTIEGDCKGSGTLDVVGFHHLVRGIVTGRGTIVDRTVPSSRIPLSFTLWRRYGVVNSESDRSPAS